MNTTKRKTTAEAEKPDKAADKTLREPSKKHHGPAKADPENDRGAPQGVTTPQRTDIKIQPKPGLIDVGYMPVR